MARVCRSLRCGVGRVLGDPRLDEPVGEVAGRGDEEGAGAAGDVGDLEVEQLVGGLELPRRLVGGLVRPGRVAERLKRVQDDFLGQRLRRVVRAGVLARRRLLDHQATGQDDEGTLAQVEPDEAEPRADPIPQLRIVANRLGERADHARVDIGSERLGEGSGGRGLRRWLVLLDPGTDRGGELLGVGVGFGEFFELGERDLGLDAGRCP